MKSVVPEDQWPAILDKFEELMPEDGGPTGLMHPEDGSLGEEDDLEA